MRCYIVLHLIEWVFARATDRLSVILFNLIYGMPVLLFSSESQVVLRLERKYICLRGDVYSSPRVRGAPEQIFNSSFLICVPEESATIKVTISIQRLKNYLFER